MSSKNKLIDITTVISIYIALILIMFLVDLIFELPYSKWVYNNMPVWLAGTLLAIESLCIIILAISLGKKRVIFNLLLGSLLVTIFLIINPVYNLAPQYVKIVFNVSLWFYVIVRLLIYSDKQIKEWSKENRKGDGSN